MPISNIFKKNNFCWILYITIEVGGFGHKPAHDGVPCARGQRCPITKM